MKIDIAVDLVITVVFMVLGLSFSFMALNASDYYISNVQVEKATIESINDNTPVAPEFTSDDVLMMLVIQDDYMQEPRVVQINTESFIRFDEYWHADRLASINDVWTSYMSSLVGKDVSVFNIVHSGGLYRWKIQLSS